MAINSIYLSFCTRASFLYLCQTYFCWLIFKRLKLQVHPWVNYEQILQKCLVGKLVSVEPNVNTEKLFFGSPTDTKITTAEELVEKSSYTKSTGKYSFIYFIFYLILHRPCDNL